MIDFLTHRSYFCWLTKVALLDAGITTLVSLVPDGEAMRLGLDYLKNGRAHAKKLGRQLKMMNYADWTDGCPAPSESRLMQFLNKLLGRLADGENLYIHCKGGHGRTGVIAACMLVALYGLTVRCFVTALSLSSCGSLHSFFLNNAGVGGARPCSAMARLTYSDF